MVLMAIGALGKIKRIKYMVNQDKEYSMIVECMNYPQIKDFREFDKRIILREKTERLSRLIIRRQETQSFRVREACNNAIAALLKEIAQISELPADRVQLIAEMASKQYETYKDYFSTMKGIGIDVANDEDWALYHEWMIDRARIKKLEKSREE